MSSKLETQDMTQSFAILPFDDHLPARLDEDEPRPCLRFEELAANHSLKWQSARPAWGWLEQNWCGHPEGLLVVRDGDRVIVFGRYRRGDPDLFAIA